MFDFGSVYPAALNVYDQSGALVNAASVSLVITLPDQSTVTPPVQNPPVNVGQYQYPYVTTQAGRHLVRWTTSNPVTAFTDAFDVAEVAPPTILSLADAKQTLQIDPANTRDDDELRGKLMGMTRVIENYLHEAVAYQTVSGEIHNFPQYAWNWHEPTLRLFKVPVIALQSLISTDPSGITWDVVNNLYADKLTGLVSVINGPPIAGRVAATYTAGYQIIPYNYLEGAKVMLQFLWQTRRGPGGLSGVIGPEELADFRHASELPRKVKDWLGPPRPIVM